MGRSLRSHHALHAVDRAHHVGLVDHVAAAHAYEQVLGVVGHAHHLMGHHLARGDDEVVAFVHDPPIDLRRDGIGPKALGDLGDEGCRDLAQLHHVRPPVVDEHPVVGDVAEHPLPLVPGHGHVGAQGGQDVHLDAVFHQGVVIDVGDAARVGMEAGEVRGQDQDLAQGPPLQAFQQGDADLLPRETRVGARDAIDVLHFGRLMRCKWRLPCCRRGRSSWCGRTGPWGHPAARRCGRRSSPAGPEAGSPAAARWCSRRSS